MGGFKGQQRNGAFYGVQDLSCHLIVKDKSRWSLASPQVAGRSPGAHLRPRRMQEAQGHWGSTQPLSAPLPPFGGPWVKIIWFLPRASEPSGSREKQPLPLPSLTLFQGKTGKIYFGLLSLLCGFEKECRPSSPAQCFPLWLRQERKRGIKLLGLKSQTLNFQEQEEGASFLPAATGALDYPPRGGAPLLLTQPTSWPPELGSPEMLVLGKNK